ncbi:MAG: type II secretion system protein [Sulfurimonas sp.]|nr:type II secretion system protein [Sulfurimonas sp.]MDD3059848.1 type II secretion system protein [Sulfurimonas sp.]MDD5202418.1 type II secretion system protein [Sulfurimonas sp.]
MSRHAFTLIEVMVAVMLVSVVIMALLQLFSNNTHIFSSLEKKSQTNQYLSFLVTNPQYGFEDKRGTLYDVVSDFDLQDELRHELKNIKAELVYKELEVIDLKEFAAETNSSQNEELQETNADMIFEIGSSVIKLEESSGALLRLRLQ